MMGLMTEGLFKMNEMGKLLKWIKQLPHLDKYLQI